MFWNDKVSGGEPGSDLGEECGNGHSSVIYTPSFWHVVT